MVCVVVGNLVLSSAVGVERLVYKRRQVAFIHQATRRRHEWGDVIRMPDDALDGGESQGDSSV
jgi:hypothetical protein